MSYPTIKNEWWNFLANNWKNIESIIMAYYPNQSDFPMDGYEEMGKVNRPLQAPQLACNTIIKELRKETPIWQDKNNFKSHINALKENRDADLARILSATWFGMPESGVVRKLPGFHSFCDLCSEEYLVYERDDSDG